MSKLKNFKEWSLNESAFIKLETEIDLNKAAEIDINFAENYRKLFGRLYEMDEGSEEDTCIGELVLRTTGEDWHYDSSKYELLTWFYGDLIDRNTGEILPDHDEDDDERFEEQNEVVPLEDAKKRIDVFLAQDKRKCRTMVYLFELCHHAYYKLKEPDVLGAREYTWPETWDLVIDFIKKSHDNFPEIFNMVPSWFNVEEILHLLPLAPEYRQKYKGRMSARKFGI